MDKERIRTKEKKVKLPKNTKLGQVFTGYGKAFAKEAITEASIKKGDFITGMDGEVGLVNKVKGKVAYVKFPSTNKTSFIPVLVSTLDFKGPYKGKNMYAEGVDEGYEFKHIGKEEHKIKLAIKDVEKKARLKANRDKPIEYEQLSLNKIMLSKVLGRGKLEKAHITAWKKLKKEYSLTEGKGEKLADKYVAKLRSEFRKLNDDELDEFRKTIAQAFDLKEGKLNEAEKYITNKYKVGDTINFLKYNWKVTDINFKPGKSYKDSFTFVDGKQVPIKSPPTNKNAVGYRLETPSGGDSAFYHCYKTGSGKTIMKLSVKGFNESVNEMKMTNKKTGEDITKHVLAYMSGDLTKKEFEKLTGLSKEKLKVTESVNEGQPVFQDTPNEMAYLDFKKWVYKNRKTVKNILAKAVEDGRDPGTDIFLALRQVWLAWATKKAKEWSRIPNKGVEGKDFGRSLAVMMKKDNLIIKKSGNKLTDLIEDKIKGVDGKACWDGYRYAGTENGKDKCVKVSESKDFTAKMNEAASIWNKLDEDDDEDVPPGYHMMPNGELMADKDHVEEALDMNDPVLVAIRSWKTQIKKDKSKPPTKKISTKQYYKLMDAEIDLIDQMKDATKEFEQLDSDMNQDAGQKGEDWTDADANRYGGDLDKLQTKIEKLAKKKAVVKKAIMNYRMS